MAWIKYLFLVLLAQVNCNIIRTGKDVNKNILLSDVDTEEMDVFWDNEFLQDTGDVKLGESLKLNDIMTYKIGNVNQHAKIASVRHFARHGLCKGIKGKTRFYTAMKSKLCHTNNSKFIARVIDDLCTSNDKHLDNWVAELFDLNEDGLVDHFEKYFYENDD